LAFGKAQTVHVPFRAKGVDAVTSDKRGGARAWIKIEGILILSRVIELPLLLPRGGVKALDDFTVRAPMKQNKPTVRDDRAAPPTADAALPDDPWAILGPGGEKARFRRDAVACRPEELGPILRMHHGRHHDQDEMGYSLSSDWLHGNVSVGCV